MPRAEQALARVDVADADDALRVHEELLGREAQAAAQLVQASAVECGGQRLDAEMRDQRMRVDVLVGPQHRAEAARVAQAQAPFAEHEVEVVVLTRGRARAVRGAGCPTCRDEGSGGRRRNRPADICRAGAPTRTVRPASPRTERGIGQRSRGSRTATAEMTWPTRCGASPRRVTSTSGSSGIGNVCLCGAPNIPKMDRSKGRR